MTNDERNHISYAFVILCMVILLVIQIHIIETQHEIKDQLRMQDHALKECDKHCDSIDKDIRIVKQDMEILNNIIITGDFVDDKRTD